MLKNGIRDKDMFSAGDFEWTASGLKVIFQVEVMSLGPDCLTHLRKGQ